MGFLREAFMQSVLVAVAPELAKIANFTKFFQKIQFDGKPFLRTLSVMSKSNRKSKIKFQMKEEFDGNKKLCRNFKITCYLTYTDIYIHALSHFA